MIAAGQNDDGFTIRDACLKTPVTRPRELLSCQPLQHPPDIWRAVPRDHTRAKTATTRSGGLQTGIENKPE